jgi:hypothetical protein
MYTGITIHTLAYTGEKGNELGWAVRNVAFGSVVALMSTVDSANMNMGDPGLGAAAGDELRAHVIALRPPVRPNQPPPRNIRGDGCEGHEQRRGHSAATSVL